MTETTIEYKKCIKCRHCVDICPQNAIYLDIDNTPIVDKEECILCGVCETECPTGATELSIFKENEK